MRFLAVWAGSHICIPSSFLQQVHTSLVVLFGSNCEFINLTDVSSQKHQHCIAKRRVWASWSRHGQYPILFCQTSINFSFSCPSFAFYTQVNNSSEMNGWFSYKMHSTEKSISKKFNFTYMPTSHLFIFLLAENIIYLRVILFPCLSTDS